MIHIPILRWGQPYKSMDVEPMVNFLTGAPVAEMSRANPGLVERDLRRSRQARTALREVPIRELIQRAQRAAELYLNGELPMGDGSQTAAEFVKMQSATTGLPENMCRMNMQKNHLVLSQMDRILSSLTRGLDLDVLARGYGAEDGPAPVSYQAQASVLGMVLPNNSPGVHTLWLPVLPLQIGLVMKPGSQEPWTPYRLTEAFIQAGIPKQAISIYPGGAEVGGALLANCARSLIFGGLSTVEQYRGNQGVQVHGPGFSKIVIGDDQVDQWPKYLDVMVESVLANGGRSCINCSSIWVSRRAGKIAEALAERLGPIVPTSPEDPNAQLAAFINVTQAEAISGEIDRDATTPGVENVTARFGPRLVKRERCAYLRPTVLHCNSPDAPAARREYMFPFVSVVQCPQETMASTLGPTLVCSAITEDANFQRALIDSTDIDRLNLGAIPTTRLNWLQPHEGNIVEFLFRARAFQKQKIA